MGILLLIAASGKSALVPFSGWLPKAMEGPTPSSAVFYGALSVHLGAFLLLRISPLLDRSILLRAAVVAVGLSTAVFAYLAGSVQTDIKSALSFASLSQVGIIVAEIGFGLRYVALFHLLSHACLRTLQFVRAPSLLHDYRTLEDAIGTRLPRAGTPWRRIGKGTYRDYLYRLGLDRGDLEARFGRLSLTEFHGLYEHSPTLAVCFLLTGLASVGFPFTLGFISTELLVDSAIEASPYVGIAVVTAAALNGIAVVRAYFLLFTGARHVSTISLGLGLRERIAVLSLAALILGGGLFPQPGVMSRERAVEEILAIRARHRGEDKPQVPPEQAGVARETASQPDSVDVADRDRRPGR